MSDAAIVQEQIQSHTAGPRLNVLRIGDSQAPAVVMLHGLRDTAWSLVPMAKTLHTALGVQVALLEHRGHGASDHSDGYAMSNFLFDVHQLVSSLPAPLGIFGHSLGGHLAYRFSALFPELIQATMVVEGLGPPRRAHEGSEASEIEHYRTMLLDRLSPRRSKSLTSISDAKTRLLRGNPRLKPETADQFIEHLLTQNADGLQWAFDSRASSVFIGTSPDVDEKYFRGVHAPTCIVSGSLSYEYWGSQFQADGYSGKFAEGEIEHRVAQFQNATHHWFDKSGHMVHYDEPERLAELARSFFSAHLFV